MSRTTAVLVHSDGNRLAWNEGCAGKCGVGIGGYYTTDSGVEDGTESLAFLRREYPHVDIGEKCMNEIDIEHRAQRL
jgi:hypothetical protein